MHDCWLSAWRPACGAPIEPGDHSPAISPACCSTGPWCISVSQTGTYGADPGDGLSLVDCRVTNAVRCVPPGNLPTPLEIGTCNRFLTAEIAAMKRLRGVLALGGTAHRSVLRACGMRPAHAAFRHGAIHVLPEGRLLADSYHVSRLNTNTGRLTEAMFHTVIEALLDRIGRS